MDGKSDTYINIGNLYNIMIFLWFSNGDNCSTFSKMKYCFSVENSVVHIGKVFDSKCPWLSEVSNIYAISFCGTVFVLFEMLIAFE